MSPRSLRWRFVAETALVFVAGLGAFALLPRTLWPFGIVIVIALTYARIWRHRSAAIRTEAKHTKRLDDDER
jgi:hypothetical protein